MLIGRVQKIISPLDSSKIRAVCTITYDGGHKEDVWVDIPKEHESYLSNMANPWLVMYLPAAISLGEDITTELPVDSVLLENLCSIQRIWNSWYPELLPININCKVENKFKSNQVNGKTACFFSGGVDSFYTLTKRVGINKIGELDDIIPIWGFDIPLSKPEEFKIVERMSSDVANKVGVRSVPLATNLRDTKFSAGHWGGLAHGCGLAGLGLLLEDNYREILIGSSHAIPDFQPWGSHYITDPLLSTSTTRIIHDGANATRVEKTKIISESIVAMDYLRVCWKESSARNCGVCQKCLRTISTLYLMDKLKECKAFEDIDFNPDNISKVYLGNASDISFFEEIKNEAILINNNMITELIDESIRKSKKLRRISRAISIIGKTPFLWRYENAFNAYVFKSYIL